MRPPEEVKKEIVHQWLAKAEQDMNAGDVLLASEPPFLYPACFHAQQAAEKYLKALLTWYQIEFPKTHAIEQLLDLVIQPDAETASSLRDAAVLTPYGVDIRYPGDQPEPGLEEARDAVEVARRVRDAVTNRLRGIQ
ncbi:MAG: HEPN domain-containing protein [Candidatus Eisenbacteria sp.]|nr:HEPN domain-containing protein [Candidatus Eisenbacteria bacterium]